VIKEMTMKTYRSHRLFPSRALPLSTLLFVLGCSSSSPEPPRPDGALADRGADGVVRHDQSSRDQGRREASAGDHRVGDSGASEIANDFGFSMRKPRERSVPCSAGDFKLTDVDWICTFNDGAVSGHVYIPSSPTGCASSGMGNNPTFTTGPAEIEVGGKRQALAVASYDWGGNHHNDLLEFAYGGKYYQYYHSSFGWGWRQCQPVDCMMIYQSKGGALVKDGCTSGRTLPIVCRLVEEGTSYGVSDFKDTFQKCPGDQNP